MTNEQLKNIIEQSVTSLVNSEDIDSIESLDVAIEGNEIVEIIVNDDYGIDVSILTDLSQATIDAICEDIVANFDDGEVES